jgi:hypothetical protein
MVRTSGYSLIDHTRNEHSLDKMKVTPITEYVNKYRKLVTTCKENGQSQYSKTNVSICLHWTTTVRKAEEKMFGDINRPLGLIMECIIIIIIIISCHRFSFFPGTSALEPVVNPITQASSLSL